MNPFLKTALRVALPYLPWALLAAGAASAGALYTAQQRAIGAQRVLLQQADSVHRADSVQAVALAADALRASQTAAEARRLYRQGQGALAVAVARADAALGVVSATRDSALAAAADTARTVGELRRALTDLAAASLADSVAREGERAAFRADLARANTALLTTEEALAVMTDAHAAMERRAIGAEKQIALRAVGGARPSTVWRWVEHVALAGSLVANIAQAAKR